MNQAKIYYNRETVSGSPGEKMNTHSPQPINWTNVPYKFSVGEGVLRVSWPKNKQLMEIITIEWTRAVVKVDEDWNTATFQLSELRPLQPELDQFHATIISLIIWESNSAKI